MRCPLPCHLPIDHTPSTLACATTHSDQPTCPALAGIQGEAELAWREKNEAQTELHQQRYRTNRQEEQNASLQVRRTTLTAAVQLFDSGAGPCRL